MKLINRVFLLSPTPRRRSVGVTANLSINLVLHDYLMIRFSFFAILQLVFASRRYVSSKVNKSYSFSVKLSPSFHL